MSPSEHELRAALRDGEGDGVDAGAVIAHARAVRHTRRVRLASLAAAVVAVGAVGTGGALLAGHSSTSQNKAASSPLLGVVQGAASSEPAVAAPARSASAHGGASSPGAVDRCPAALPQLAIPGGGGTGQFGGSDPLFAGAVVSLDVCGYRAQTAAGTMALRDSITLSDGQARELVGSLNAASTKPRELLCVHGPARALAIYARTASSDLPVVTVHLDCRGMSTNGTAVRYGWQPPPDLAAIVNTLT